MAAASACALWPWERVRRRQSIKLELSRLVSRPQRRKEKERTEELLVDLARCNPVRQPAKSVGLVGRWRLAWSSQTSNRFLRPDNVLGGYSTQDIHVQDGKTMVENAVRWPGWGLCLVGRAAAQVDPKDRHGSKLKLRIDSFGLGFGGKEVQLLKSVLGTPKLTVKDTPSGNERVLNQREGSITVLYLDEDIRVTLADNGLLFLHQRWETEARDERVRISLLKGPR